MLHLFVLTFTTRVDVARDVHFPSCNLFSSENLTNRLEMYLVVMELDLFLIAERVTAHFEHGKRFLAGTEIVFIRQNC